MALTPKPRDLGLLLHRLRYIVPVGESLTDEHIEEARVHCKMSKARLDELRQGDLLRFWDYMYEARKRRLEYMLETGKVPPPGWTPLKDGEQDKGRAVLALQIYRKTGAVLRAEIRKRPDKDTERIWEAWQKAGKYKSSKRQLNEMAEVLHFLKIKVKAATGERLTLFDMLEIFGQLEARRAKHQARKERRAERRKMDLGSPNSKKKRMGGTLIV